MEKKTEEMLETKETKKEAASVCGFVCVGKLGWGAYATIFAIHNKAGEVKALKVDGETSTLEYQSVGVLTWPEIDVMCRLRHPHLMAAEECIVHDLCPTGFALVMPVASRHLFNCKWTVDQKIQAFYGVAAALQFLHHHKILHLDVTPHNLLVDEKSGCAYLADFGASKPVLDPQGGFTSPHRPYLHEVYRPPENGGGSCEYSAATDVWGLGLSFLCSIMEVDRLSVPSYQTHFDWYHMWFSDDTKRRATLTHWISKCIPDTKQSANAIHLLTGMLEVRPADRMKLDQVVSHPLFHLETGPRVPIPGTVLVASEPQVKDVSRDFVSIQRIIDMFRTETWLHRMSACALFLAIDLAYRTLHLILESTSDEQILAHNITCTWIACKYYYDTIDMAHVIKLVDNQVRNTSLLLMERHILAATAGRLYRPFLYDAALCEGHLVTMINTIIPHTREYTSFVAPTWLERNPIVSPYVPKDVTTVERLMRHRRITL